MPAMCRCRTGGFTGHYICCQPLGWSSHREMCSISSEKSERSQVLKLERVMFDVGTRVNL
jgi:hypothetical protein